MEDEINRTISLSLENITTVSVTFDDILEHIKPRFYNWIFIALFGLTFIIGLTGNCLVCYSVWRSKSLKSVTNYFIVNLAVADVLVILVCLPATVISDMIQSWFLGIFMCKFIVYLQRVSVFVSVLTLMSISVERYLAICHPLQHHGNFFKTRIIIFTVWLVSLIIPSPDFYNMGLTHHPDIPESLRPWLTYCNPKDEQMEKNFQIFLIIVMYLIPLIVMSVTYVKIARCLWSSASTRNAVSQNLQYESAIEHLKMRRRTAKMLIVVVITFGLCFLPVYVLNIVRYTGVTFSHDSLFCLFWTARFLVYFNSAINPVIYNFMSVKFREQFKTACFGCYIHLRCLCRCFGGKRTRKESSQISRKSDNTRFTPIRSTFVTESRLS